MGKVQELQNAYEGPDELKEFFESCDIRDLIDLIRDLCQYKVDPKYIECVRVEAQRQAREKIKEQKKEKTDGGQTLEKI